VNEITRKDFEDLKKEFETLKKSHIKLRENVEKSAKIIRDFINTTRGQKRYGAETVSNRLKNHYLEIGEVLNKIWKEKY